MTTISACYWTGCWSHVLTNVNRSSKTWTFRNTPKIQKTGWPVQTTHSGTTRHILALPQKISEHTICVLREVWLWKISSPIKKNRISLQMQMNDSKKKRLNIYSKWIHSFHFIWKPVNSLHKNFMQLFRV